MSIYDYEVTLEDGSQYALSKYKGRPMLIVNTATKCGFAPQFDGLEKLYDKFKDQGLVVLGFLLINLNRNWLMVMQRPRLAG